MERILQISTALLCLLVAVLADPPADVSLTLTSNEVLIYYYMDTLMIETHILL